VNKLRRQSNGFSKEPERPTSKTRSKKNITRHAKQEKQAMVFIHQGKLNEAEEIYKALIHQNTNNHVVYSQLAAIYLKTNRWKESIKLLEKAISIYPNQPEAYNNLGNALRKQGDLSAAISSYSQAIRLKPNHVNAHFNLGNALKEQNEFTAAISSYRKALRLNPNHPEAHNNLGTALRAKRDLSSAIAAFKQALDLKPNFTDAYYNLGVVLQEQGELEAAINAFNKALELEANHPDALNNLGVALQEQGDLDAAINTFNAAINIKPDHFGARINLSMAVLLLGDFENGWRNYDYRLQGQHDQNILYANPLCDQWNHKNGRVKTQLLLVSEQGLGDTLQFMRYLKVLKEHGINVSLCAQPSLHALIQSSGIDPAPLTPDQANQVDQGQWMPLLSVPGYLSVSPDNPIVTEPYIKTTQELINKWQALLAAEQRPIVGINWQGNPDHEQNNSKGRSLPLETFAPISTNPNISLLSLQKGFGSEQLDTCSFKDRFISCQDQINHCWDFLETAAIITNCDLVITSDTCIAHLAGGMGKPTWLLLKQIPDWRWGLEGDSSFWYPSMRLFRQHERGNWAEVMERVAAELRTTF